MSLDSTKARRLVDKKTEMQRLDREYEEAKREYKAAEQDFWMDMEEGDDTTFSKDLGEGYGKVTFSKRETITGRILDKEAAEASLREMGLDEAVLQPHHEVRKKVLNEHVNSWLKEGSPLPKGIDFIARRYITVTKKGA